MSKARKNLNWRIQQKYVLDKYKFKEERNKILSNTKKVCSMCGSFCAMKESTKIGI
ncbi:MAG: phosphomethylpyrimidine synthase ThiC, partial [Endomicrobiia bacterium]